MSNEPELKACPFCGLPHLPSGWSEGNGDTFVVVCPNCQACGPAGDSEQQAETLWNTRRPPLAVDPVPWAELRPFTLTNNPSNIFLFWVVANDGTRICTAEAKEAKMIVAALNGSGQEPQPSTEGKGDADGQVRSTQATDQPRTGVKAEVGAATPMHQVSNLLEQILLRRRYLSAEEKKSVNEFFLSHFAPTPSLDLENAARKAAGEITDDETPMVMERGHPLWQAQFKKNSYHHPPPSQAQALGKGGGVNSPSREELHWSILLAAIGWALFIFSVLVNVFHVPPLLPIEIVGTIFVLLIIFCAHRWW